MKDKSLKELFEEQAKLAAKARQNPFKHRWKLDDPEFVRQRKRWWPHIKKHFENSGCKAKELKQHKAYFLEGEYVKGDWGVEYWPGVSRILCWTPCSDEQEMRELVDWLATRPDSGGDQTVWEMNFVALVGIPIKDLDSPIGYALGNEQLIAEVVLGSEYREENYITLVNGKLLSRFVKAAELISEFELRAYYELMSPTPNQYSPLVDNIGFYLSCIHFLESKGEFVPDRSGIVLKDFSALISAVFHFVEPGQTGEKPPSKLAELASGLKGMFLREDTPAYLKRELAKLPPSKLLEHKRESGSTEKVSILTGFVERGILYGGSGSPEVLRGCEHSLALSAFYEAWIENDLLPEGFKLPAPDLVDLQPIFSKELIKEMGYRKGQSVPAWRVSVWYTPKFSFSNSDKARFGCDLYFIFPAKGGVSDTTTSLLYYPRINDYYLDYFPSNVVHLKERQIRRAVLEKTGKHLLTYGDGIYEELGEQFLVYANLNVGFSMFLDDSLYLTKTMVTGPIVRILNKSEITIRPWKEILGRSE